MYASYGIEKITIPNMSGILNYYSSIVSTIENWENDKFEVKKQKLEFFMNFILERDLWY